MLKITPVGKYDFIPCIPEGIYLSKTIYGVVNNDTSIVGNICYLKADETEVLYNGNWYILEPDAEGDFYFRTSKTIKYLTIKKY